MEKTISVIIPCYNDSDYIEQTIDSILAQTYLCNEIIVVDDGSNKKTKEVLKKINNKITKLITQENKGQSAARNIGIDFASGEYILVCDSDDFFEPKFCEAAIAIFKKLSNAKLVTCHANLIVNNKITQIYVPSGGSVKSFLIQNSALGSAMFKKDDWRTCGGYDESMIYGFEDWEFYISLLKKEGVAHVIPQAYYNYRKRKGTTTSKANKIKFDLIKYIYAKHEDIIKENHLDVINFLLKKVEIEEKSKYKQQNKIDFKIGKAILKPLRFLKSFLR